MPALLKTTQIQEPSSATVNMTLDTSGGVAVGGTTTFTGGIASAGVPIKGSSSGTTTLVAASTASGTVTIASQTGTLYAAGPTFHASAAGSQTVTSATLTKVLFATEEWDTNSNFASSTFTPTVAGYYQINAILRCTIASGASSSVIQVYKNGSSWSVNTAAAPSGTLNSIAISDIVYCNGSTDYIEIYTNQTGTAPLTLTAACTFSGFLARGA